jgi:cytochrome d ubiquinol oxidase subunit I
MNVDLARWQFATTSIYHFLFVPITIGTAFMVAVLQTQWHRSGNPDHLRATRFFSHLLLINVAIGVVTGLVQEFQFGMDWAAYSRFVGGVFGAPLAMEGLAAFFLESTFLGLWVFGWGRLSRGIHLFCIWMVALGSAGSAAFIMAANSWMQHPVGYTITKSTGRADLTDIWAVLTNPVFVWGYLHVILASLITGSLLMLAVSAWHLRQAREVEPFHRTAWLALIVLLPTIAVQMLVGSQLGVIETRYQPMKIAAAESQWTTCGPCSFSLFQIGGGNNNENPTKVIAVPHLLSILATLSWNGTVVGLNQLQSQYQRKYGRGYYIPNVFIQYWSMRVMAYLGALIFLLALWGGWLLRRRKLDTSRWFLTAATWAVVTPFFMNTAGWLLTESGRQPWIVQGLMKTANGITPLLSAGWVWFSLITLVLVYLALGVTDAILMLRFARRDLPREDDVPGERAPEAVPVLTY